MIKKIKQWYLNKRYGKPEVAPESLSYTYEQLENAYKLGYNDGKRDGLSIARQQATKSLKEILSWQNENQQSKKK